MAVGGWVGHSLRNARREVKRVTDLYRKEMTQRKDLYNQLQVRAARIGSLHGMHHARQRLGTVSAAAVWVGPSRRSLRKYVCIRSGGTSTWHCRMPQRVVLRCN
jgi:hypothetical protein